MRKQKQKKPQPQYNIRLEINPWDLQQEVQNKETVEEIPTYRKQIVQKFLGKIHTKQRVSPILTISELFDKKLQGQEKGPVQRTQPIKKQTEKSSSRFSKSVTQILIERKQPHLTFSESIFKCQYEKRKNLKMKTNVITMDPDFSYKRNRSNPVKSKELLEETNKTFTKKLKLKDLIGNKKNITRSKTGSQTKINKVKDTYFLCDFGNMELSKSIGEASRVSSAYRKISSGKKRSISQQQTRVYFKPWF